MTRHELHSTPSDSITGVGFHSNDPSRLLASSWDSSLRIWNVNDGLLSSRISYASPLLGSTWLGDDIVGCSLDGSVLRWNVASGELSPILKHDGAASSVAFSADTSLLATASWDKSIRITDVRDPRQSHVIHCDEAVYSVDLTSPSVISGSKSNWGIADNLGGNVLVALVANRDIVCVDLRHPEKVLQKRASPLKFLPRIVKCFPSGEGFVCTSVEGRVGLEFFEQAEDKGLKPFAFKCHRETSGDSPLIHLVNAVAFHPEHGTFATGGSDGIVSTWDPYRKKRIRQIFKSSVTGVTALAFSQDGTRLAIACGETILDEAPDPTKVQLIVQEVTDNDFAPRKAT